MGAERHGAGASWGRGVMGAGRHGGSRVQITADMSLQIQTRNCRIIKTYTTNSTKQDKVS